MTAPAEYNLGVPPRAPPQAPYAMLRDVHPGQLADLIDSHTFINQLLNRANDYFRSFRIAEAVEEYNEILTMQECEGHPIALLNRSLAYYFFDYPSLAAIDAYRVLLAIGIGTDDSARLTILSQILSAAETNKGSPKLELGNPNPLLGSPLLALDLVAGGVPIPQLGGSQIIARNLLKEKDIAIRLLNNVRARATYRLCLALMKCGGGAIRSALIMIWLGSDEWAFELSDSLELSKLEDAIMQEVEKALNSSKTSDERERVETILKSEYTRIPLEKYPWDFETSVKRDASDSAVVQSWAGAGELLTDVTTVCSIKDGQADCWRCEKKDSTHTLDCRLNSETAKFLKWRVDPPMIDHLPTAGHVQFQSLMLWRLVYLNNQNDWWTYDGLTLGLNDDTTMKTRERQMVQITAFNPQPRPIDELFPANQTSTRSRVDSTITGPTGETAEISEQTEQKMIHWSFKTHVLLPFKELSDLAGMRDMVLKISKLDGWQINMLMAKLDYYLQSHRPAGEGAIMTEMEEGNDSMDVEKESDEMNIEEGSD